MKKAHPQVKQYLNSVLSNIEKGRDMNQALQSFFSSEITKELRSSSQLSFASNVPEEKDKKTFKKIVMNKVGGSQSFIEGAEIADKIKNKKNFFIVFYFMHSQMIFSLNFILRQILGD